MMLHRYYVEKVVLLTAHAEDREKFCTLAEKARREGIAWEEIRSGTESGNGTQREAMEAADSAVQEAGSNTLYITDDGCAAQELVQAGAAVLGWSHERGGSQPGAEQHQVDDAQMTGIPYVMEEPEELEISYLERVYRRYRSLPWEILETERCVLRETIEDDVDAFFAIYSDPKITRYTEDLYPTREQERKYVRDYREYVYRYYEFGVWTVILKETGEVIGRAGLSVRDGYEEPELGFIIGTAWQRRGLAREVCEAVLAYGHEELGFAQVQALVRPENEISLSLCRKLGFAEYEKVLDGEEEYVRLLRQL